MFKGKKKLFILFGAGVVRGLLFI